MGNTPFEKRNRLLGETVAKNFEKRGFEACYVETAQEAKEKALSYIKEADVISWGGCMSAVDCGLMEELKSGKYPNIIDRDTAKTQEERVDLMRKAFFASRPVKAAPAIMPRAESRAGMKLATSSVFAAQRPKYRYLSFL